MAQDELKQFKKSLAKLSKNDLRELVVLNTYRLAMVRGQVEAIAEILIKKKLTTYEKFWTLTHDQLKEQHVEEEV